MEKISVVELYDYLAQTQKTGSSGYQRESEINANIEVVTMEIFRLLLPWYAKDEQIQYLLSHLIAEEDVTISGTLRIPDGYSKYIDTHTGNGKIVYPRNINEYERILASPIDNPTKDSDEYYAFFDNRSIKYLPEDIGEAKLIYFRSPEIGEIKLEAVSTDERDYVEASSVKDIDYPKDMFSLFSAYMLEKFGYQNRESVAIEFSKLGIERDVLNIER